MKYYIGADLGTSALKLLLVNVDGEIIKTVSREYAISYPNPGWSEQNPEDWWNAFVCGVKELISGLNSCDIRAIGVGGQMHGLVTLDKDDTVIRPAILWNDGRTDKQTDYLNTVVGKETLSSLTANIAFAGFTAPKILWMRENEPQKFARISKIMLPKDYINYKLTGVHCSDYSDASGMLLLDVKNKCWSSEMLNICNITEAQMPKLFESYEAVGTLSHAVANLLGLNSNTVVVAGAGDNAAAAIGTKTVTNGACNISLGTSGTIFIANDNFSVDRYNALHSFCHASGTYHLMGCILSAASCNKWFCDGVLKTNDYIGEQAAIRDDMLGCNDIFFLPYLMGERSTINDTDARGTFIGLRMDTTRADMLQAVLEGVAFAIRDNLEIAKASGTKIERSTLCGGGAKSMLWQKIICNVLDVKIDIPKTEQGPGYGAAMLAMVGDGVYDSVAECSKKLVKIQETISPQKEIADRYEKQYLKFKEIYPSVKELFKKIK
ncbi:MAG: xylulokinase [Clostridia bacterium]|nr:xylulokinase [Clostridia bacterium]